MSVVTYSLLGLVAFAAAMTVLARLVSVRSAMVNATIIMVLAAALVLQDTLNSRPIAYIAFGIAALAWIFRWAVNAVLWMHNHRLRDRAPSR